MPFDVSQVPFMVRDLILSMAVEPPKASVYFARICSAVGDVSLGAAATEVSAANGVGWAIGNCGTRAGEVLPRWQGKQPTAGFPLKVALVILCTILIISRAVAFSGFAS